MAFNICRGTLGNVAMLTAISNASSQRRRAANGGRLAELHRLSFRVSASKTIVHALFSPRLHWLNKPKPHWRFAFGARAKDELRWLGDFRLFRHTATLEVRAADGVGDLSIKHEAANETPLCGDGSFIVVVSYVPVDQRRLSPGARKIKQTLPLIFGFGAGSGNHRLFGV